MTNAESYQDPMPFKERGPDVVRHLGMTPSAAEGRGPRTGDPERRKALAGRRGEYRLVFQSMPVPGLPEQLAIGRVLIQQTDGPVWSQWTHIVQRPGWRPVYEKWMEHRPVGVGYRLTVCTLAVELHPNMSAALNQWRDEVLAAVSLVVSVLDERVAQLEIAEDVITQDVGPDERVNVFDTRVRLREFTPSNRVRRRDRRALQVLSQYDTAKADPLLAAGRWYLRAAQSGPTPDAIVYLWIALEALSKPPWGTKLSKRQKRISDVEWVERAVAAAGLSPAAIQPDLGRLAGLRAEVVHGGVEAPALLRDGFYTLEAVVRFLIRARTGVVNAGWMLQPGVPCHRSPFRQLGLLGHRFRKIAWREGGYLPEST